MHSLLKNDIVYLRPLTIADIDNGYSDWFNNTEVIAYNSHGRWPMTKKNLEDFIYKTESDQSLLVLAVCLKENRQHVGNISLQRINWIDRNAEIAFVLGELKYHGKGIMYNAGSLLINHAFKALNLHRVYCGTLETNIGMSKLALKLGMKEEGRRKEAIYKQGVYLDIIEYGILRQYLT